MYEVRALPLRAGAAIMLFASASYGATSTFTATLAGGAENPAVASTATGFATLTMNTVTHVLTVDVSFSGLVGGPATAAHIQCCVAPFGNAAVAVAFSGFPNTTSGTYSNTFDTSQSASYAAGFLTSSGGTAAQAEAALFAGMATGMAYVNIHDATYPGGEIREFLAAPDLTITKSHAGPFTRGQLGAEYTIAVTNSGTAPTDGTTVTVTDTLPAGLTATSFGGAGWTCDPLPALSCTRTGVLNVGLGYPYVNVVVNVAPNAPSNVTNTATVAGGGEAITANDSVDDPTDVVDPIPLLGLGGLALLASLCAGIGLLALKRAR